MTHDNSGQQEHNVAPQHQQLHRHMVGVANNSSMIQAVGGAAAVILTILGLVGLSPMYMAAIATIGVAAALAVQGLAVSNCYSHVVSETGGSYPVADLRTGLTAEFIAGATGVILGVLALAQVEPETLTAVAAIVLGSGVLLGAGIANRLAHFAAENSAQHPFLEHMAADAVTAAAGAEVLVGGGAIVLGVIALAGPFSFTLTLVALLALGASSLMTSTAVAGKMGSIWSYH